MIPTSFDPGAFDMKRNMGKKIARCLGRDMSIA